MIRVLIADDHAVVREGLKQLFASDNNISVVAEAECGVQVLAVLSEEKFDLVLLDMNMPGMSGANLVSHMRLQDHCPPILILSMHNEVLVARKMLAAGASGYLTKDSDPKTVLTGIYKVAEGGHFIDPKLVEQMAFDSIKPGQRLPHELLSSRELEILTLLVRGKNVNDIAEELIISNKTVSTHKARLMLKMNCQNYAKLVRYAVEYGLVGAQEN